jgi:hypothetical protein
MELSSPSFFLQLVCSSPRSFFISRSSLGIVNTGDDSVGVKALVLRGVTVGCIYICTAVADPVIICATSTYQRTHSLCLIRQWIRPIRSRDYPRQYNNPRSEIVNVMAIDAKRDLHSYNLYCIYVTIATPCHCIHANASKGLESPAEVGVRVIPSPSGP